MLIRILDSNIPHHMLYVFVDQHGPNVEKAYDNIIRWAVSNSVKYSTSDNHIKLEGSYTHLIKLQPKEFNSWSLNYCDYQFDFIIGQSFLDLIDLDRFFVQLKPLLQNNGKTYFPNNFDGVTQFLPTHASDRTITTAYHQSMQAGSHGAQTGRHVPGILRKHSFKVNAIGSSDWAVLGTPNTKSYPKNEEYFLRCILHFVEDSLSDSPAVTTDELREWLDSRYQQLENGELIYIAHQLDVLASMA